MIRHSLALPLLALTLVPGATGLVHAQAASAQPKHDSNAPVDIESDRTEVDDRQHRAIWTGHVHAVQQDMTLTADRMTANYTGSIASGGDQPAGAKGTNSGAPQLHRLDATGNVVVTRPTEVAHGNYGIYDLDKRLITMIGNVRLDRTGPNPGTTRGGRLVIDLNTSRAVMDGSAVGGNGAGGSGGRVSGRFSVPQHNDDKSAAPAAKPAGK